MSQFPHRDLPELMLTVDEAAVILRMSKSYTKKLVASGELVSVTIGRSRRIRVSDLGDYVANLVPDRQRSRVGAL